MPSTTTPGQESHLSELPMSPVTRTLVRPSIGANRSALVELCGIFALLWLLLGSYALLGEPVTIAGATIRQSAIREAVYGRVAQLDFGLVPARVDSLRADGGGGAAQPAAPAGVHVDSRPQRILLFGDSMIDELMLRLADYCLQNGHRLHPAIWYAAGTVHWARSDRLDRLIAEKDPTVVIAVLGSNELHARDLGRRRSAVRKILKKIGNRPLAWIGPPNWTEDTGINQVIAEAVGSDRFFRSAELDLARKRDGIHPTRAAAAAWMDAVARWVMTDSAHPFLLELPTQKAPRPPARVFPPPERG